MIRLITLFLTLITLVPLQAQRWLQGAGSYGRDELNGLSISSSNSIFSTGIYGEQSSFDAISLAPFGNGDVFIAKQQLDGTYSWVKRAGGLGIDRGNCIVSLPDNKIVVGGTFTQNAQFGTFQVLPQGIQDGFICQLNESGDFTWLQTIGGTGFKNIRSVAADPIGNLFIIGEFSGEAIFGNSTYTSAINPETLEPSKDIFLAKLSNTGVFLWAKQGSADFDDQAFTVTADDLGNCYLTGKFSDTLNFISNHLNTIYNAGFIMKVNGLGEELWFKKITGGQISLQGLIYKNNSLILGGSFSGNLTIQGAQNTTINNSFSKKCFLAKLNSAGNIIWTNSYGSDNAISLHAIDTDTAGDIYVGGTFRCGLTGFRTPETSRLWETVGYRDIYVAKFFQNNGTRLWAQHYAGQKEDVLNALKVINIDDVIMGGFTRNGLSIPIPDNYTLHASNRPLSETASWGNSISSACFDSISGNYELDTNYFAHIATKLRGENDIFISRPVALNRALIDQFAYYGTCGSKEMPRPFIVPYGMQISSIYTLGPDTIEKCGGNPLTFPINIRSYDGFRREFTYHWSGLNESAIGDEAFIFSVYQTSWTYAERIYADGCPSFEDSVYHIIDNQMPPFPSITSPDITLYNMTLNNLNSNYYGFYIPQDTITLNASPQPNNSLGTWTSGFNINDQQFLQNGYSLTLNNPHDTLTFTHQYNGGLCKSKRAVRIYPFLDYAADVNGNFLDSLNLGIFIIDSLTFNGFLFQQGDTIIKCRSDFGSNQLHLEIADSTLWANQTEHFIFARVRWKRLIPGFNPQTVGTFPLRTTFTENVSTIIIQAGQVTYQAEILMPPNDAVYQTISKTFYVKEIITPNDFSVDFPFTELCFDDTLFAIPSYADSIVISGANYDDLVWQANQPLPITEPGDYQFWGQNTEPIYGCRSIEIINKYVTEKTLFPILSSPQNGIICPGEAVTLLAEVGVDRFWIGPVGDTLGTGISITVNEPGLYRYIQTDESGCRRSSEFIAIELKTIPYLQAEKNVICPGETLEIGIIADPESIVQWLSPLSGNQLNKIISSPGTYKAVLYSCGIHDTVSIPITLSSPLAEITAPNGLSFCPTTGILLFANAGNYELTWFPTFENDAIITNYTGGLVVLEAINPHGCTAKDSIIATELTSLAAPIITQSALVCSGDSVQLSVNQDLDVAWLDFPNGNILDSTFTITLIAQESLVIYCKTKESTAGCESATTSYQILLNPSLNLPEIIKDSIICLGDAINLAVIEDSSIQEYQWFGPNAASFVGANWIIPVAELQFSGNYQLQLIPSSNFCSLDPLEFEIQIQPNPTPIINSSSNTICAGTNLTLTASTSSLSTFIWKIPDGTEIQTSQLNLIAVSPNNSGLYQIIENLNGCIAADSLFLTVNGIPEIPIIIDSGEKCMNDTLLLSFQNWQSGDSLQFLSPDGVFASISQNNISLEITDNTVGTYTFNLVRNGCPSEANAFTLSAPIVITSDINDQYNLCIGDLFQVNSLAHPSTFITSTNWIHPQGNISNGETFQISSPNLVDSGSYKLQIIDVNSCTTEFLFHLEVNNCNISGIPNSFTPNADGINDTWSWKIPSATEMFVLIFNRWGEEVANIKGSDVNWNGHSFKNSLLPSNTYYYIIKYKKDNQQEEIKGFLEIKY